MNIKDINNIESNVSDLLEVIDDLRYSIDEGGLSEKIARDFYERISSELSYVSEDIDKLIEFVKDNVDE